MLNTKIMKKYEKTINGKTVRKRLNEIVIKKNGMATYNPSEEMVLADGWVQYIVSVYEPTEEEILNREKEYKIEEILRHDASNEINIFYIRDVEIWLDKATRVGLKLRFDAEIANGRTNTTLWYEGIPFNLELDNAVQMLNALELYASACYDNTQMHISQVKNLDNIEDIEAYDYTTGYPEKLYF